MVNVENLSHKLWIILEKSAKIRSCHCNCITGMDEVYNHAAAAMFQVEAAVCTG